MTKLINEPIEEIILAYDRWNRNRDFLTGEDAVKRRGTVYLPRLADPSSANGLQSDSEYEKYLFRIPFFAGAARIKDGLKGLIFRKPPTLDCPPALQAIFDTITPAGHSFNDLAEDIVEETLITGFTGLLIDHPTQAEGLTMANALSSGFRPFIAVYQGQSILEIASAVVGNVQKLVRIRLLDNDDLVRELILDENGVYNVIIHERINGSWVAKDPIIPTKNGQPLNDIPFVLVGEKPRHHFPTKAPLDDVVLANLHCYLEGADAKNSRYYSSAPILWIDGAERIERLVISPGATIQTPEGCPEKPVTIKFVEFSGAGQAALESAYNNLKEEMAMLGLRMLAADPKGVEAADTVAIRRASENSILAALARRVSDRLQEAANWVSWWMDGGDVTVNLNVDFAPQEMDAREMTAWINAFTTNVFSFETLCSRLMDGNKLPEDFDIEDEKKRLASEAMAADRPSQEIVDTAVQPTAGVAAASTSGASVSQKP